MPILKKGLVQIYTGDGKGKTTAALGLAWRMLGAGGKVYICSFLKPAQQTTGETQLAPTLSPNLTYERLPLDWNIPQSLQDPQQTQQMRAAIDQKLAQIKKLAQQGHYDLMILDEIVFCLNQNLADTKIVTDIIQSRAPHVELVLTGRGASKKLIAAADLVTQMNPLKHPYQQGLPPRPGIEY